MTDLATLGLRIESQEAAVADERLDSLAVAAGRAETSYDSLAVAARRADGSVSTMNVAVRDQQRALTVSRNAMGLTAAEGLNLSRQFADIGVTAAMGMNPLMIAIQQGPQLIDIFAMSAARAGTTITVAMRSAAAAAWAAVAPFAPMVLAITGAAALIGGTFALATRAADQEIGKLTDGMGLTEDQMKRLKEESVDTGVTMGDVFRGTGTTIKEMFVDVFGDQLEWVAKRWDEFLDGAARVALGAVKAIGTAFLGTLYAIRDTWGTLPLVVGDAAITAANAVLRAVEMIVNKSAEGINRILVGARALSNVRPDLAWLRAIPNVGTVSLGQMGNPLAGQANRFGTTVGNAYGTASGQVSSAVDGLVDDLIGNIRDSARARIRSAAGDAGGAGGDSDAAKKAKEVREVLQQLPNINLQPLNIALIELVDPLKLIADEMRLIDDLARQTASGLASAFGETGRALGDLLTTMSGYQSRLAEIDLAEREYRLSAVQADRERAYAQVQNYGDMLGAAKQFFDEGSTGYRMLQSAEAAWRVFQFAMSVQAMAQNAAETSASVAGSAAKGTASAAAGAAKMFEALGPFGFPVVAAMIALLASLGLRGGGGGGAGRSSAPSESVSAANASVQAGGARQDQARSSFAASVASQVDVRVTADRDGIHAYVAGVAEDTARPMVVQGMAATAGGVRAQVAQDMDRTYVRGG